MPSCSRPEAQSRDSRAVPYSATSRRRRTPGWSSPRRWAHPDTQPGCTTSPSSRKQRSNLATGGGYRSTRSRSRARTSPTPGTASRSRLPSTCGIGRRLTATFRSFGCAGSSPDPGLHAGVCWPIALQAQRRWRSPRRSARMPSGNELLQPRLVLLCGLPASGKTTLARELADAYRAVRLNPDEWESALDVDPFDEGFQVRLEAQFWALAQRLLVLGTSV